MYLITNGQIVTEHAILHDCDMLIEGDRITAITRSGSLHTREGTTVIDAAGGYVTPGFIDMHSDYIEHMAAPRPTTVMDFKISIRELEREVITHGITTFFHSLSLLQTDEFYHKPIRDPANVRKLIELIACSHQSEHLIRHRFHARMEIDNLPFIEHLKRYIAEDKVHLVSFMDHTPGQGQYRDLEMYRHTFKGYKAYSDNELDSIIRDHQSKEKLTFEGLKDIADAALARGIPIASHDDDSLDKLQLVHQLGATISEFPIALDVARKAQQLGMKTVAGAPNVLLGGSHSGNLAAAEAIAEGCIDMLCSDYYPPSLLHAVFKLHREHGLDLVSLLRLVTIHPARAVRMDHELGSLEVGKKADLLIIHLLEDGFPVVNTVFVDGHCSLQTGYRHTEGRTVYAYDGKQPAAVSDHA